jgi:hypothetical protein
LAVSCLELSLTGLRHQDVPIRAIMANMARIMAMAMDITTGIQQILIKSVFT